jgi:hypothetical protein
VIFAVPGVVEVFFGVVVAGEKDVVRFGVEDVAAATDTDTELVEMGGFGEAFGGGGEGVALFDTEGLVLATREG